MSDLIISDEPATTELFSQPPLYLQHYLDEQQRRQSHEPVWKPPGPARARIVECRGNVIVLEFADATKAKPLPTRHAAGLRRFCHSGWDVAMLLLLLGTAAACVAAFLQ